MSREQTPITAEEKERVAKEMSKRDWKDKEQTPIERLKEEIERSEILSDDTKRILSLIDWNRKIQEEEEFTQAKVLEALGEVDKYCDGKISHFSKAPMDLQGIHATREVKTYLNILRNRSKTKQR